MQSTNYGSRFALLYIAFFVLLLGLFIPNFADGALDSYTFHQSCASMIQNPSWDRTFAITIRGSSSKKLSLLPDSLVQPTTGVIARMTAMFKTAWKIPVRFYFTAEDSGKSKCSEITASGNSYGIEALLCSESQSLRDFPRKKDDDGYCRNDGPMMLANAEINLLTKEDATDEELHVLVNWFMERLVKRFELQSSGCGKIKDARTSCLPSTNSPICGDGYLEGNENCDVNPFFLNKKTSSKYTAEFFCKDRCRTLKQDDYFRLLVSNAYIRQSEYPAAASCSVGVCGTFQLSPPEPVCLMGLTKLDLRYCFDFIGITPALTSNDFPPKMCTDIYYTWCGARVWGCKSHNANAATNWANCNDAQFGGLYKKESPTSTNLIQIDSLPSCRQPDEFFYQQRTVNCSVHSTVYEYSDIHCSGVKPPTTRQIEVPLCKQLVFYDLTPTESIQAAASNSWEAFRQTIPSIQSDVSWHIVEHQQPSAITLGHISTSAIAGCDTLYRRKYACRIQDPNSGSYLYKEPHECASNFDANTLESGPTGQIQENRCAPIWGCALYPTVGVPPPSIWRDCNTHPDFQCTQCDKAHIRREVQCWGRPPGRSDYFIQNSTPALRQRCEQEDTNQGRPAPPEYKPCLLTNYENDCYETICLDKTTTPPTPVDCTSIWTNTTFCTPNNDALCGAGQLNTTNVEQVCTIRQFRDDSGIINFQPPPQLLPSEPAQIDAPREFCNKTQYTTCNGECTQRWECSLKLNYELITATLGYTPEQLWGTTPRHDLNFDIPTERAAKYCNQDGALQYTLNINPFLQQNYCGTLPFIREIGCFNQGVRVADENCLPSTSSPSNVPKPSVDVNTQYKNGCNLHCYDYRTSTYLGECNTASSFDQLDLTQKAICSTKEWNSNESSNNNNDLCNFNTYYNIASYCMWTSPITNDLVPVVSMDKIDFTKNDYHLCQHKPNVYSPFSVGGQLKQKQQGDTTTIPWPESPRSDPNDPETTNKAIFFYNLPCFVLNNDSQNMTNKKVLTRLTYNGISSQFESITSTLSETLQAQCKFELQCKYKYNDTNLEMNLFTNSIRNSTLLSQEYSKDNCKIDFDCAAHGVCGTVIRESTCYATLPNQQQGQEQQPLSMFQTQFENHLIKRDPAMIPDTLGTDTNADIRTFYNAIKNMENECRPPVEYQCNGRNQCYERYCALPKSTVTNTTPSLEKNNANFSKDYCKSDYHTQQHCPNIFEPPGLYQCGRYQVPVYEACWDRFTQSFILNDTEAEERCSPEFQKPNVECSLFQDCIFDKQICGFTVTATNVPLTTLESEELCDEIFDNVNPIDGTSNYNCNNLQLCGQVKMYSRCTIKTPQIDGDTTEPDVFELSHDECLTRFGGSGSGNNNINSVNNLQQQNNNDNYSNIIVDNEIEQTTKPEEKEENTINIQQTPSPYRSLPTELLCENYDVCSTLVCSRPQAGTTHDTADKVAERIRNNQYTPAGLNNLFTTQLTSQNCVHALSIASCDDLCGHDQRVGRSVGCVARITAPIWSTNTNNNIPQFKYDPNPTRCGGIGYTTPSNDNNGDNTANQYDDGNNNNNNNQTTLILPYASLPCSGFGRNCNFQFQCSLNNGADYSTAACRDLACPIHAIPTTDITLFSTLPPPTTSTDMTTTNLNSNEYIYNYQTRCVSTFNNTIVSTSICQSYRSFATSLDFYKENSICQSTDNAVFCNINLELPLDFTTKPLIWNGNTRELYPRPSNKALTSYTQRYNTNCNTLIATTSLLVSLSQQHQTTNTTYTTPITRNNFNVELNSTLYISFNMNAPLGTVGFIYLIPVDDNLKPQLYPNITKYFKFDGDHEKTDKTTTGGLPITGNKDDEPDYNNRNQFQQLPYLLSAVTFKRYENNISIKLTTDLAPIGTYRVGLFLNRGIISLFQYNIIIVPKLITTTTSGTTVVQHIALNQTQRIEYLITPTPSNLPTLFQSMTKPTTTTTAITNNNNNNNTDNSLLTDQQLCEKYQDRCYNGRCVIQHMEIDRLNNDIEPTTITTTRFATCQCFHGFTGQFCTVSSVCSNNPDDFPDETDNNDDGIPDEEAYELQELQQEQQQYHDLEYDHFDLTQSNNNNNQEVICNTTNGILMPTLSDTWYQPQQLGSSTSNKIKCNTCHCFGHFDPSDGCNTCTLQCGIAGKPNNDCTACICNAPYFGTQCELTKIQFSQTFVLPPPIIKLIYSSSSHLTSANKINQPGTLYEYLQLNAWKRILIAETAVDFGVSISDLDIIKFGTLKNKNNKAWQFVVIFDLTVHSSYDYAYRQLLDEQERQQNLYNITTNLIDNLNMTELNKIIGQQQQININNKIVNFFTNFAILKEITKTTLPQYNYTRVNHDFTFTITNLLERVSGANIKDFDYDTTTVLGDDETNNVDDDSDNDNTVVNQNEQKQYELLELKQRLLNTYQQQQQQLDNDEDALFDYFNSNEEYKKQFNKNIENMFSQLSLSSSMGTLQATPSTGNDPITPSFLLSAGASINHASILQYKYKPTMSIQGIAADAMGEFIGYGSTYNTTQCAFPIINPKTNKQTTNPKCPKTPTLSTDIPKNTKPRNIPWTIIWVVIVLFFVALIVFLCILLCCAWSKRILCFKNYEEKKLERLQNEANQLQLVLDPNPLQQHRLKVVQHEIKQIKRQQKRLLKEKEMGTMNTHTGATGTAMASSGVGAGNSTTHNNSSQTQPTAATQQPPNSMVLMTSATATGVSASSPQGRLPPPPRGSALPQSGATSNNNSFAHKNNNQLQQQQQKPPRKSAKPKKPASIIEPGQQNVYGARAQRRAKLEAKERRRQAKLNGTALPPSGSRRGSILTDGTAGGSVPGSRRGSVMPGSRRGSVLTKKQSFINSSSNLGDLMNKTTSTNKIDTTTTLTTTTLLASTPEDAPTPMNNTTIRPGSVVAATQTNPPSRRGSVMPRTGSTLGTRRMSVAQQPVTRISISQLARERQQEKLKQQQQNGNGTTEGTPLVVIEDDELDDDDDDEDDEGADLFGPDQQHVNFGNNDIKRKSAVTPGGNRKRSIYLGGMKRLSVVGLPPGWNMVMMNGKPFYVNEITMQSTTLRPLPNGKIPDFSSGLFD